MPKTELTDAELAARAMEVGPEDATAVRDRSATADIRAAVKERNEAEKHLRSAVDDARAKGVTWIEIGSALGVSYQAAMQKYKH